MIILASGAAAVRGLLGVPPAIDAQPRALTPLIAVAQVRVVRLPAEPAKALARLTPALTAVHTDATTATEFSNAGVDACAAAELADQGSNLVALAHRE